MRSRIVRYRLVMSVLSVWHMVRWGAHVLTLFYLATFFDIFIYCDCERFRCDDRNFELYFESYHCDSILLRCVDFCKRSETILDWERVKRINFIDIGFVDPIVSITRWVFIFILKWGYNSFHIIFITALETWHFVYIRYFW